MMMSEYYAQLVEKAKQIRAETPVPAFTDDEKDLLLRFFSNTDKNTFFVFGMPEELISTLISMYSRLKNPRGLRGLFLDGFVKDIPSVALMGLSPEIRKEAVSAKKIKDFMRKWLDKYGHNSIARTGVVHICFEKVSVMAAKAIEEGRPGAGYLELSTRYVDMSAAGFYPLGKLFGEPKLDEFLMNCLNDYTALGASEEEHFKKLAASLGITDPSDVQLQGKFGDHVGNILPSAVYTSVGATLAGEAFQRMVSHLMREQDPECDVLAQEVLDEAEASGAGVLLGSHFKPTEYETESRFNYLDILDKETPVLESLHWPFTDVPSPRINSLRNNRTDSFQKLNREFELGSATFSGVMSFRSWRDLHRQGFCTHFRSLVAPLFLYLPPDISVDYYNKANARFEECRQLYNAIAQKDNVVALQKLCPMGVGVRYRAHANLRQWEFVIWQRSKQAVHHEVRTHVLAMYNLLCEKLPWWKQLCRCNQGDYFFARGAELPPIDAKILTEEIRYPWKKA
jgi:thymidylate synthase ThyX